MDLIIPEEVLQAAHVSAEELRREVAVLLFQKGRLTLARAARLAGLSLFAFQHLLASREIGPHYDARDFDEDVETLRKLGRL